jgi:hypothetical protein
VEAVRIIVGSVVLEEPEQSMQRPLAAMRPSSVWGQVAGCQGCFNQRWTRGESLVVRDSNPMPSHCEGFPGDGGRPVTAQRNGTAAGRVGGAVRSVDEIIAAHSLDDVGKQPDFTPTLRWIMIHMVEETARHVWHLDTVRELLDGQKGYY